MTVAAAFWLAKHAAIGATIGATTAAVTGGDPVEGAKIGAITGPIGGGYSAMGANVAPSATAGASAIGSAVGGGIGGAGSSIVGGLGTQTLKTPGVSPVSPTTVQAPYASQAERERKKRRRGYGSTILAGGLGTTATTRRTELGP